jgi:hypothetical protein
LPLGTKVQVGASVAGHWLAGAIETLTLLLDGAPVGPSEAITLLLSTISHFGLMLLPCFSACAFVIWKGARDIVVVGVVALVAIGALGYLAFWLWFFEPQLGRIFSLCLPIAAALFLIWIVPRFDAAGRSTLKALLAPVGLIGAAALLVLSTGFVFGGLETPFNTAGARFSHLLPADNILPYLFAEGIRTGHVPKPLSGDWLSSDRPPLQTGIVLSQSVYLSHPRWLQYTVISVILQSLWIFALWLFLAAFDLDSRAIGLALTVCILSGFVFLNSFYVWPKLLAGAYMLGFSGILLAGRFMPVLRETTLLPLFAGALAALGLLAHGGSVFAVFGIILTLFSLRRRIGIRALLLIGITCFCLYLPWMLYQKLYDPPGDRLLKLHLAGVANVDSRPLVQVFTSAYKSLGFHEFLKNKLANVHAVADHQTEYWLGIFQLLRQMAHSGPNTAALLAQTSGALRGLCFFFFVPNLGFLVLGPVSLVLGIHQRYRSREWKTAAILWLYIALTATIWCLVMFIPGMTVIHTSTYAMILLAFAGSILALWAVSPWLAVLVGSLQIEINVLLFVSFLKPDTPFGALTPSSLRFGTMTLALLSLVCTFLLLKSLAQRETAVPSVSNRR